MLSFSDKLKELGLSKTRIAEVLGVSRGRVSEWGEDPPQYATAYLDSQLANKTMVREIEEGLDQIQAALPDYGEAFTPREKPVARKTKRAQAGFADDILLMFLSAVMACLLLFYVAMLVLTDRACLEEGYPKSKVSVTFGQYCVKRVNQTDVVVPLDMLRDEKDGGGK